MATYAEQLASVQAAITTIEEGGQEVRFEGRMVRYADLPVLYAREEKLRGLAERESRGGVVRIGRGAGL
jgi:hypothetical protein